MPSTISNQTYNLTYATALSFVVGPFIVSPAYCPLTYELTISPTIADSNVVVFDATTLSFNVSSNNLNLAGTFTITVIPKSPALASLSPTLSF